MGNCLHPSKEKTLTISDGQTGEVKPISNGHVPAGGNDEVEKTVEPRDYFQVVNHIQLT